MDKFMEMALDEAQQGLAEGGIPIGSVLIHAGAVMGRGHNRRVQEGSVIRHAEMDALENAGRQKAEVYRQSTLYTTLSPCPMCSGAIRLYGIPVVVIGENFSYQGDEAVLRESGVTLRVLQSEACIELLKSFQESHPQLWAEDIGVPEDQ